MSWLVAGATGLLGRSILRLAEPELTLLLRGRDWAERARSLERRTGRSVGAVAGDVTADHWGTQDRHLAGVELVLNAAAQTSWSAPSASLTAANTKGALEGLRLAARLGVPYVLVSTLYAGYATSGVVGETLLTPPPGLTRYERSKLDGEWLVADAAARLDVPVLVLRVGCLLGDAADVDRNRASAVPFLRMLRLLGERRPGAVPVAPRARLDVGPTDVVAAATCRLATEAVPADGVRVRHVALGERAPLVRTVLAELDASLRRAGRRGFRTAPVPARLLTRWSALADRHGEGPWGAAQIGLRYLASEQTFAVTDGAIDVDWVGLRRALGLIDPPAAPVAEFYREWMAS